MKRGRTLEWVNFVLEVAELQSLSSIWIYSKFENQKFAERREDFFWMLGKILESDRLKLKKNGDYLIGTPKELVQLFREKLPQTDIPYPTHPHLDMSQWFFDPACPGEAVWRVDGSDGTFSWMHCP